MPVRMNVIITIAIAVATDLKAMVSDPTSSVESINASIMELAPITSPRLPISTASTLPVASIVIATRSARSSTGSALRALLRHCATGVASRESAAP